MEMMMHWVVPLKSWTRSSAAAHHHHHHVSVAVAVFLFALFSLLLSCTTMSLSGSALLSFTSNITAFFINDDFNNNPMSPTAAAGVGGIHDHQDSSSSNSAATNLGISSSSNNSNNSSTTATDTPNSIHSILADLAAPAAAADWEEASDSEQETGLSSAAADWQEEDSQEQTVTAAPAAQTGQEEEEENSHGETAVVPAAAAADRQQQQQRQDKQPEITVAAAAAAPTVTEVEPRVEEEKFLMPILSYQVGAGNQLMEYMSAAIIARAVNRTLCLTNFFAGPTRHSGVSVKGGGGWLAVENRYNRVTLSRFVRVTSKDNCLKQCHSKLDARWLLKPMREPVLTDWKSLPTSKEALQLSLDWVKWQTPGDIAKSLGGHAHERCVGVGGLYPGPRWRGAFLAVSAFLRPSQAVATLVGKLQELAIGINVPYLAVHWRFEESECGPHKLGLCFVRCSDGAVIDSGLHPDAKEWVGLSVDQCKGNGRSTGHFRGVSLDKADVFDAIFDHAHKNNVKTMYLATDGWIRGERGIALVTEAVENLRKRGLSVVGLWKIKNLPNFSNGRSFDPMSTLGKRPVNSQQIALIEQEICARSSVFLGSGASTWSLAVFRLRLARRRAKEILESRQQQLDSSNTGGGGGGAGKKQQLQEVMLIKQNFEKDEAVIEELMKDKHAAGLACRFTHFFNRIRVNATVETYADEAPDGWLDLEACEGRIGRGGKCEVAKCFR